MGKLKVNRSIGWNLEYATMNVTQIITDGADCYPWHEKYAWWPVKTISGRYVWREKVYKRKVWVVWGTGFHMEPEVQYATLFEMLSYDKIFGTSNGN
jgi:hypothetical protein